MSLSVCIFRLFALCGSTLSSIWIKSEKELVITIIIINYSAILCGIIEHVLVTLKGHWIKYSISLTVPYVSKKENEFTSSLLDFNIWVAIISG